MKSYRCKYCGEEKTYKSVKCKACRASVHEPTPEQILEIAAEIRKGWTPRQRRSASGETVISYQVDVRVHAPDNSVRRAPRSSNLQSH